MSITTMPIDLLRAARSYRADSFRTQPRPVLATSTRSRVASLTSSGELTTLDTVPSETRARAATSFMLTEALRATLVPLLTVADRYWPRENDTQRLQTQSLAGRILFGRSRAGPP